MKDINTYGIELKTGPVKKNKTGHIDTTDLVGRKFGELVITEYIGRLKNSHEVKAKCSCGNEKTFLYCDLSSGKTARCGCKRNVELAGKKINKVTVLEKSGHDNYGRLAWKCKCDCGKEFVEPSTNLVQELTWSCGCIKKDRFAIQTEKRSAKFKGFGNIPLKLFHSYQKGAILRGLEFKITIEYAWELFLKQAAKCALSGVEIRFAQKGETKHTASLDRIDSDKGYEEGNVQWVHKHINFIKSDKDQDDFINLCKSVALHTKNKKNKIIITGACGFLGKALLAKWHNKYELVAFNRDENKQFYVRHQYPNVNYFLGDVANFKSLSEASRGCSYGVFAASMKHIDAVSENPEYAKKTILDGAINSRKVCEDLEFTSGVFVSTDKSQSPSTLYGALKMAAAESFTLNSDNRPRLTSLSYGNIFSSSGSILIKLNLAVKNKEELVLFSDEMTRFGMHVDEAVNLIEEALFGDYHGISLVPHLWSYKVKDMFDIYKERFGLQYKMGELRVGEKLHEIMIPEHSVPRAKYIKDRNIYTVDQKIYINECRFRDKDYSSKDYTIAKRDLEKYLETYNFFL